MNSQFVKGVEIDWDRIDRGSYLRNIEALQGIEQLRFD